MPGPGPLLCPKENLVYELNAMSQDYKNFMMTKKEDRLLLALKIPWQEAMEQVLAKMLNAGAAVMIAQQRLVVQVIGIQP